MLVRLLIESNLYQFVCGDAFSRMMQWSFYYSFRIQLYTVIVVIVRHIHFNWSIVHTQYSIIPFRILSFISFLHFHHLFHPLWSLRKLQVEGTLQREKNVCPTGQSWPSNSLPFSLFYIRQIVFRNIMTCPDFFLSQAKVLFAKRLPNVN